MNGFLVLWRKELFGYFLSPVAYATLTFFLVVMGLIFYFLVSVLSAGVPGVGVMSLLFGSPFYWMTLMVVIPLLTMRLFAEERRMGTLESLLTAPISDASIVAAKFAGVFSFFLIMWLPTLLFLLGLFMISAEAPPLDTGSILSGYIGALLSGAFFLSLGMLCSITTSNQIIAAITCFAFMIIFFFAGFVEYMTFDRLAIAMADMISPHRHLTEFSRGVMDTRPIFFYLSGTVFFLFTATRILESRRWK